ncbi:FAD binding domain-containing protein [Xylariomycetidae sp. FL2044]|nr:FAD binding domain-containing protein [Xylariomycetidae sp. FL2044]
MGDTPINFCVIIVGAGPVGLVTALVLSRANIDFVLLERRGALDLDAGASVCVWPHNVRLLDQLGLLEEAHTLYMPIKTKRNLRRDGSSLGTNNMLEQIGINHGHPWMCFRRGNLVSMLYKGLPHPEKLMFNRDVTKLEQTTAGVTVTCADGSVHQGSIVIGADGVHSKVRRQINKMQENDVPFSSTYCGLYGYTERTPALDVQTLYETHSRDFTIQITVGEDRQQFLVCERLAQPTRDSRRYGPDDEASLAKRIADVRFPGRKPDEFVSFGEIWDKRQWSTMANLEEGITEKWHDRRFVLVGDSVHRMTPNIGLSMNSGFQGVVQLVNRLYGILKKTPEPDTEDLDRLFSEYQSARMAESKQTLDTSGLYTRLVAWSNPVWRFVDQYIMPFINGDIVALDLLMAPIVQKGHVLSFLRESGFKQGRYRYRNGPENIGA